MLVKKPPSRKLYDLNRILGDEGSIEETKYMAVVLRELLLQSWTEPLQRRL